MKDQSKREESFEEWYKRIQVSPDVYNDETYLITQRLIDEYARVKYEKLLAEKDKQLEEARGIVSEYSEELKIYLNRVEQHPQLKAKTVKDIKRNSRWLKQFSE